MTSLDFSNLNDRIDFSSYSYLLGGTDVIILLKNIKIKKHKSDEKF